MILLMQTQIYTTKIVFICRLPNIKAAYSPHIPALFFRGTGNIPH